MVKFVNCRGCDFYKNFLVHDEVLKAVAAISQAYFSYKSPNKTVKILTSNNLKTHLKSCVR